MTTSRDLIVREDTLPVASVDDARVALRDATLGDIKEIHDRAAAFEVYARAREMREAYLAAGEVKLWAERRAGEIRRTLPRRHGIEPRFDRVKAKSLREDDKLTFKEIGRRLGVHGSAVAYAARKGWGDGVKGVPLKEFDDHLGVPPASGYNWERLALIPEPRFVELVEKAKESDGALTATGLLRRDGRSYETRVEAGIFRLSDGRLSLRWRRDGIARMKTLDHSDLVRARKELAKARGQIKDPQIRKANTVGDAYALVRRALQALDTLDGADLTKDAKQAVREATAHLHKAEDSLVVASSALGMRYRRPE